MAESYIQNTQAEVAVYLALSGVPVTNVAYTGITVQYKKQGQSALQTKPVQPTQWLNLGGGLYTLVFTSTEMDTLGSFIYTISGAGFDAPSFSTITVIPLSAAGDSLTFVQDQQSERTIYLELAGSPALNVLYTDVTAKMKKANQIGFIPKPLTDLNWINLGSGFYTIKFSAADMSNVGSFIYTLEGTVFDNFLYDEFVIMPVVNQLVNEVCAVRGTLKSVSGVAGNQVRITARVVQFPAKFNNNILMADSAWTFPDNLGNWQLSLVRNAIVIFEIERAGIRAQITVPDQPEANILDLLPPFANDYTV